MQQTYTKRFAHLLRRLIDPAVGNAPASGATYAAFEAGPLRVCRLEERRVLSADVLGGASFHDAGVGALGGGVSTLSQPTITVPGNQTTSEGASLVFSPAAGREIRVDAPGLGAGPLRVDISAFDSLGQVTPILGFGSTAGLTVTGNGVNVFQLQGALPDINAALASLTFYSPDDGDFTIALAATDPSTGENASASIDVDVANVAPQISIPSSSADEGSNIEIHLQLFDPGAFDNPQVSWSVANRGVFVASGVGSPVQFFAANDGVYELTVTAVDKDGANTTVSQDIFVSNVNPTFDLSGSMQNGVVNLTVNIRDKGHELFTVEIYWTSDAITPETFVTRERLLSFSHRYTPEEIEGELTIAVHVIDDHAIARQTLQFREGAPAAAERPEITSRPQDTPPERTAPARVQSGGTTTQIVSADFGRAVTQGTQAAPALHQFVLRVVGPDGEESESYPLPGEALADLPDFLTRLGVPDGHYRVYLVAGDLERLVIDGHLRAGRIVDPTDEAQGGFDFPRSNVAGEAPVGPSQFIAQSSIAMAQLNTGRDMLSVVGEPASHELGHNEADGENSEMLADPAALEDTAAANLPENDEPVSIIAMPMVGGAIVVCAAATAMYATASHRSKPEVNSPRFCKRARQARKLARQRPATARF